MCGRLRIKACAEKFLIHLLFTDPDQLVRKSADGHVGDREQSVELDTKLIAQMLLVLGFQPSLRWGKGCSQRIVDKIEGQKISSPVAQTVQQLEGFDTLAEDSTSALFVDVFGCIAGQACDDFYFISCQEIPQVFKAGLEQNSQIATIKDV